MAASRRVDPTARFFEELGARGYEPLLRKASGTSRFEIVDGKRTQRWDVTVDRGQLSVSRRAGSAPECVVRVQKALFDGIVAGKVNAVAAVLRGEFSVDGDWRLLVWMQRLFPGPRVRKSTGTAGYARRRG